jgi:hypothetical protein
MNDTDRLLTFAAAHDLKLKAAYWKVCFIAQTIVGAYSSETRRMAEVLHRSVDQIENMAKAAYVFQYLLPFPNQLGKLKRVLSPSHFAAMYALIRAHDLSPLEVIEDLRTANDTGASVMQLRSNVTGANGGHIPPLVWRGSVERVDRRSRTALIRFEVDQDIPEVGQRVKCVEMKDAMRRSN